jgi:hypothetical protein
MKRSPCLRQGVSVVLSAFVQQATGPALLKHDLLKLILYMMCIARTVKDIFDIWYKVLSVRVTFHKSASNDGMISNSWLKHLVQKHISE